MGTRTRGRMARMTTIDDGDDEDMTRRPGDKDEEKDVGDEEGEDVSKDEENEKSPGDN